MTSERGASLIVALMILSFLTVLGGALLSTSFIDVLVGDNFRTSFQLVYAAEAALERAREQIHLSPSSPTELLNTASGSGGMILDSNDLDALLASDDRPLFPSGADATARTTGEALRDASGREIARYWVWLRNDVAEGVTATIDTNRVLSLVGFARIGTARKTLEMKIRQARFPKLPAAFTLDGTVASFGATDDDLFRIDGNDEAGRSESAIGATDSSSLGVVTSGIPELRAGNYSGSGGGEPDVDNVAEEMEASLKTPSRLEILVSRIAASATDVYSPVFGTAHSIGDFGSSSDYRIAVVNGDCDLGPGTGYGILVVRGDLRIGGTFSWYGLILTIGQGGFEWGDSRGEVHGGVFLARTRGTRTLTEPLGPVLESMGSLSIDLSGAAGPGIQYDSAHIDAANRRFPYTPISIREY
jgi:hypothetical protein